MPDFEEPITTPSVPLIALVIDESSSMATSRETTVQAVNEYLDSLKTSLPADSLVSVVKFSHRFVPTEAVAMAPAFRRESMQLAWLYDRVKLGELKTLTLGDYTPNGGTPLYDAIGAVIKHADQNSQPGSNVGPIFFGVMTDGEENSSKTFTSGEIKKLISTFTELGWTFAFMGVDIDAYATGGHLGFTASNTVNLGRGTIGTTYAAMARSTSRKHAASTTFGASDAGRAAYAAFNAADFTFSADDKAEIEKDSTVNPRKKR